MARGDGTGRPFRFIRNRSRATAANVYLLLYPKPVLAAAIRRRPAVLDEVWQALTAIPTATLLNEGRVYGGGLHKLEPRELAHAPLNGIAALVTTTAQLNLI